MMNIYGAEKILKRRDKLNSALEKEREEDRSQQVKSYNKRIIKFMHNQFTKSHTKVEDRDFQVAQESKLEQAIRCTLPQKRSNSVTASRCKRFMSQIPLSCRNSRNPPMNISVHEFQNTQLDLNPKDRHMFQFESTQERVRRSTDQNQYLDTSPCGNVDQTFNQILRQGQKDRSKDLGTAAFRYRETTAERLLTAEMNPMNFQPPQGIHKYKKTRNKLFMPETVKWYMPVSVEGKHEVELGPRSPWEKNLPFVKDAKQVHGHLHAKTHFKSTHSFFLESDTKKVDLEDREVCQMIKDIQKIALNKRKSLIGAALLRLLKKTKFQSENDIGSQLLGGKLANIIKRQLTKTTDEDKPNNFIIKPVLSDSSDEDPEVNLTDFKTTTKELLQNTNYLRRPSVQTKGPHQFESQIKVFNRLIINNKK